MEENGDGSGNGNGGGGGDGNTVSPSIMINDHIDELQYLRLLVHVVGGLVRNLGGCLRFQLPRDGKGSLVMWRVDTEGHVDLWVVESESGKDPAATLLN